MQISQVLLVLLIPLILKWFGDYRSLRFCAAASVVALLYFGENDMNGKAASNDFTYGIYADTQYVAIPKRERLGEEFIKEAFDVSKLYQAEVIVDRLKYKIRVSFSFNFDTPMKNVSRLFGMADSISFSKENVNYDLTASLEFYTHVVVKRGISLAP